MPEMCDEREARRLRIQALVDADDRQEEERERRWKQQGRPEQSNARKRKRRGRFMVDVGIVDMKLLQLLTGAELQVYMTLYRSADAQDRVRISQPMIGDALDMGERTVRRILAALDDLDLIRKWQDRCGATGHIRLRPAEKAAPTAKRQRPKNACEKTGNPSSHKAATCAPKETVCALA